MFPGLLHARISMQCWHILKLFKLFYPEELQRQHRLEMTLQTRHYPPVLLLGTSGKVPSKANQPPLFLYFLCCFRCVNADTEQVRQSSSKAALCSYTCQNRYLQTRVRIQHRQVTLEAENCKRTAGQKGTSRTVGCIEFFSNPQLPFPTTICQKLLFFKLLQPPFFAIYFPAVLLLVLRDMEVMETGYCSHTQRV